MSKNLVVGIGEALVTGDDCAIIVTHALGSCVGIAAYDSKCRVGGILHYMLPTLPNKKVTYEESWKYGEEAIPNFFKLLYKKGATKDSLRIVMAGGSELLGTTSLPIGRRNVVIAERLFKKNNVFIANEDTGGAKPRTLYLEMASGRVWTTTAGVAKDL